MQSRSCNQLSPRAAQNAHKQKKRNGERQSGVIAAQPQPDVSYDMTDDAFDM